MQRVEGLQVGLGSLSPTKEVSTRASGRPCSSKGGSVLEPKETHSPAIHQILFKQAAKANRCFPEKNISPSVPS